MFPLISRRFSSQLAGAAAAVARHTNVDVQRRRCAIFDDELRRQRELHARVEKIEVQFSGVPHSCTLVMNRHCSTPFDCLRHISQRLCELSVLAEVDGEPWDMHRPLADSCRLRCLFLHDDNNYMVNKAFWRSCSLMLGAVLEHAFSDIHYIQLHSFPSPNIGSGSFVYDADVPVVDWTASETDLRSLSALMVQLGRQRLPFQRLVVSQQLAQQIFADNQYKLAQVASVCEASEDGCATLYRIGSFIDMSRGPAISHTGLLGRCSIMAAHKIGPQTGSLFRFQGVALPSSTHLKYFTYSILERRAKNLNPGKIPIETGTQS